MHQKYFPQQDREISESNMLHFLLIIDGVWQTTNTACAVSSEILCLQLIHFRNSKRSFHKGLILKPFFIEIHVGGVTLQINTVWNYPTLINKRYYTRLWFDHNIDDKSDQAQKQPLSGAGTLSKVDNSKVYIH